ncbi:hypothetical protein RYX36_033809 [Vicia faba]
MTHTDNPMIFVVGIIGNIASFFCFIAPISIFYRICKKKTTEGFQSCPYVAALFSAMLWIFYAYIKTGEMLIITINAFGCLIETIYLVIYITYCPKQARNFTLKLICLLNLGGICLVIVLTHLLAKERTARIELLGWICVVLSTSVFAAPLSVILPNIVGITFGIIQMTLYGIYRKNKPVKDEKLPEHKDENNQLQIVVITHENVVDVEAGGSKEEKEHEKKQKQTESKEEVKEQPQKDG